MDSIFNIKPTEKIYLTIKEAAEYSGLGEYKLKQIISEQEDGSPWLVSVSNKTKVKRKEFEEWLSAQTSL